MRSKERRGTGIIEREVEVIAVDWLKIEISDFNRNINRLLDGARRLLAREGVEVRPNGTIVTPKALEEGTELWYAAEICSWHEKAITAIERGDGEAAASAGIHLGYHVGDRGMRRLLEVRATEALARAEGNRNAGRASGETRREQSNIDHEKIKQIALGARRAGIGDRALTGEVHRILGDRNLVQPSKKSIRNSLRDTGVLAPKEP